MKVLDQHFEKLNALLAELRLEGHDRARENVSYLLEAEPDLLQQIMELCRGNQDHWALWRKCFDIFHLLSGETKISDLKRIIALTDTAVLIRSVTTRNVSSPAELRLIMNDSYLNYLVKGRDPGYTVTKAALLFIALWEKEDLDWSEEDTSYEETLGLISENLTFFHQHLPEMIDKNIKRYGEVRAYFDRGASPLNQGAL